MDPMMRVVWIVLAVLLAYYGVILLLGAVTIVYALIGAVFLVAAVWVVLAKVRRRNPV